LQVLKLAAGRRWNGSNRCCAPAWRWPGSGVPTPCGTVAPPVRKVIELAGLTPSLAAYDTLLGKEVAHGG